VTGRRAVAADRAEQALRAADERYRDLFESSPAGIAHVALDGVPVSVNRAWASLMGYDSPEQFLSEVASVAELYEDAADRETMVRIVREQGEAKGFEVRLRRRDGATVWVAMDAGAITNAAGEVVGLQGIGVDITERKRAEEALRESEERFRLLAENSRDVIRLYDVEARIRYASPSCGVVLGYAPEEFVGHHASEFQHPDEVAGGVSRQQAVIEAEDELTVTYRSRHRDGGYVWLESSLRALRDEPGGVVTGFQEAARDVGERKEAEQVLRASEERYRELFEESPAGRVESTLAGTPLRVNRAFASLLGYASPEQFMTAVTSTNVLYADRSDREAAAVSAREHGAVRGFELRMRRRDGTTVWVAIDGRAVTNPDGGTVRWQASVVDISERKRVEEALRESEERFRLLAEASTDVITRVSTQSIMSYVSPASRELYGFDPEEMVGHSAWDYIHPEDYATVRQASEGVRVPGRHHHAVEYRALRSDGGYVWVESKVRTLWDPVTGQAAGFHNATRDISERKQAEAEIRRAKEEAEQATRAKSDFLSGMSHELRTPLNALLGFTGTLLMGLPGPLNDEQTKQLRTVQRSARHLLSLINDLLDLALIESGKLELHPEPFNFLKLAEEVAEGLRPLAERKGLGLEVRCRVDPAELTCDRRAVSQILINLTNNAIKFTDYGSVRLDLSQRLDGNRSLTRFAVIDTGRGIAPEDHERLFAAFEQIKKAGAPLGEGTGLGLHISQALAGRIGGNITFESVPGEGSTFALEVTGPAG
jgi:protein-histidine pros-kinase